MALWPTRASKAIDAVRPAVTASQSFPSLTNVYELTTGQPVAVDGVYSPPVSRALAMSLPALARGVTLKVTSVAGLPIDRISPGGERVDPGWIEQPEPGRSRFATFCDLGYDLEFDGVSYLRIHERTASGEPRRGGCEYIPLDRITITKDLAGRDVVRIDGKDVNPADVIGFPGWHAGIRRIGARIIRTALALEAAAQRYADTPRPSERLKNVSEYELTDEEIDAAILQYKTSRNAEAVAYVNQGFAVEDTGWDAAQLQLVEARQFTATQLANLVGVPAHYIAGAAAASGGNVSYANVTQDARALVDYALKPLARALESRLSMSDVTGRAWADQVTPRGTVVRINMDGLLRGNPLERADLYAKLIPLGVLTVDEARAMEDLAPIGRQQA